MKRYYDQQKLVEDVRHSIEQALQRHGIETPYSALGIGTVLEASASPFKWAIYPQNPLTKQVGEAAYAAFTMSRLMFRVALISSPHSLIVNPLMEAIAAALLHANTALAERHLLRNTLRLHLNRPTLSVRGLPRALSEDNSLGPAFATALDYLLEAEIVKRKEGDAYRLSDEFES